MIQYYRLGSGLVGEKYSEVPALGPRTINFYMDNEGMLANYPGKTDQFRRDTIDHAGTPPTTDTLITRIQAFTDVWGVDHIVFVRGDELCEKYGNGYVVLYTFKGRQYFDGVCLPDMFVYQSKLIVTNFGDPVLIYDGRVGVHPLGVHEAPLPPDPRPGRAPYSYNTDTGAPLYSMGYGPFRYKAWWFTGRVPTNGPGDNLKADGESYAKGVYQLVAQYTDRFGNKGPVSAPSGPVSIAPNSPLSSASASYYTDDPTGISPEFLAYDWTPPQIESHIDGIVIGSTLNLNQDGGSGIEGVYYQALKRAGNYPTRSIQQLPDYLLAQAEAIDLNVQGPPSCGQGTTWGQRICLWDLEDPFRFLWSDLTYMGQFRSTNEFRANDRARQAVSLGDRVLMVSQSAVEVLYDNNGVMQLLEQQFSFGSNHGRSLLDVGGSVFGLWTRGWGFFDGEQFVDVEAPYFLKGNYVDNQFYLMRAVLWGRYYLLSFRLDATEEGPTNLLMFNLDSKQWYLLDEQVWDLTVWRGALLGCSNSIYELFKGQYPPSNLEVYRLVAPQETPASVRSIEGMFLYMEPSSSAQAAVEVEGAFFNEPSATKEDLTLLPAYSSVKKNNYPVTHWKTTFKYAGDNRWSAPGFMSLTVDLDIPIASYNQTIFFDFPEGHPIRLQGLGINWSDQMSGVPL